MLESFVVQLEMQILIWPSLTVGYASFKLVDNSQKLFQILRSGVFKSFDEEKANALRIIILNYNIFLSDVTFNVMIPCL